MNTFILVIPNLDYCILPPLNKSIVSMSPITLGGLGTLGIDALNKSLDYCILVCVWVVCTRCELDLLNLTSKHPPCCWDEPPPCSYRPPRCLATHANCASSLEAWSACCNSSSMESMSCTALPATATSSLNNLSLCLVFFLSAHVKIVMNIRWNTWTMFDIVPPSGQVFLETCRTTTLLWALAIIANKSRIDVLPILPNLIRM
jgi:hypothetical protein